MKKYSAHSHTESSETDDLEEAKDIAMSMSVHFGIGYVVDNDTKKVIEEY